MSEQRFRKDFPVSWQELHRDCKALAWRLLDKGPWTGIIAVTRGGLVPACIMARELDIRLIETLCIASYTHQDQGKSNILKNAELAKPDGGKGWLVIDDLVDTGGTFKIARQMFPQAHFAAVYAKPEGARLADSYITEVSQDTWIFFPWDMDTRYAEPLAGAEKK